MKRKTDKTRRETIGYKREDLPNNRRPYWWISYPTRRESYKMLKESWNTEDEGIDYNISVK